jgi:thiol-disulfide isomerase/thioredoxin
MKEFKKIFLASVVALGLTGCASVNQPDSIIKSSARKVAPLLNGETLNGSNFSTNTNKVTVVNVWASWCAPCRAEAPILEDFAIKNPQIQFVGILTRDNLSAAQAFYQRFKITYPTFIDDSLINKFQGTIPANGIPTTLVIDKDGRVAARISGATTVANLQKVLESITGGVINA